MMTTTRQVSTTRFIVAVRNVCGSLGDAKTLVQRIPDYGQSRSKIEWLSALKDVLDLDVADGVLDRDIADTFRYAVDHALHALLADAEGRTGERYA